MKILIRIMRKLLMFLLCIYYLTGVLSIISENLKEVSFFDPLTSHYMFKGRNAKMSFIKNEIHKNNDIKELEIIKIFCTNEFFADSDFTVEEDKYTTNAPDLIIIAPKIIVESEVKIDLSCNQVPGYPDNIKKAKNGEIYGANGDNGKSGLNGLNGGNLIIVYGDIIGSSENIKFISNGGTGGPGQDGIKVL